MPLTALRPTLLGALAPTLALLTSLTPSGVQALGLGRPQVHSTLGQPLDVSVPLTLAEGERLGDSCLRAEVSAGDARVPAGLLQLRVEGEPGQQRLRLQSLVRVEEPALRITLALGCPLRLTREFNAFIDPPATSAATAALPLPAPTPLPAVTPPAAEPVARTAGDAPPAPAVKPRPRPKPPRQTGPRLVLERPEVLVGQAPRPARAAASAPEVELTPELEAQIAQLEQTVAQLRAELQGRQAAAASAAQTAAAAPPEPASAPASVAVSVPASAPAAAPDPAPAPVRGVRPSPYSDPMTWLLTLGLSLLAGAVAFYGSRWLDERRRRERAYWRALHSAEGGRRSTAAVPASGIAPAVAGGAAALPDEGQHTITKPQPRPMAWPPVTPEPPQVDDALTASQAMRTQPMPSQAVASAPLLSEELPAELTIADELLDLQQQVDFLQLLGQHEAAADLLAARLSRGNAGAMPYLVLLELCQHRGQPEVFAQRAMQFEQRFGAAPPQWAQSLARGRSLDACPSVIAHLQVVWADPAGAMKMLQELLARGGGPGVSNFDLPAYRDLLLLYSVARDLFEAGLRGEGVDLMLPLDSSFGSET